MNAVVPGPRPRFRALSGCPRRGFIPAPQRFTRMNVKETLEAFLEEGKDWERKQTSIRGVSILRMPRTTTRPPTLAMEINPVDDRGLQMKRKGIMIRSPRELEALRGVLSDPKVVNLMEALALVVPPLSVGGKEPSAGVIEV
jgi:hypothetical protein